MAPRPEPAPSITVFNGGSGPIVWNLDTGQQIEPDQTVTVPGSPYVTTLINDGLLVAVESSKE
jgi:hypothetical protein